MSPPSLHQQHAAYHQQSQSPPNRSSGFLQHQQRGYPQQQREGGSWEARDGNGGSWAERERPLGAHTVPGMATASRTQSPGAAATASALRSAAAQAGRQAQERRQLDAESALRDLASSRAGTETYSFTAPREQPQPQAQVAVAQQGYRAGTGTMLPAAPSSYAPSSDGGPSSRQSPYSARGAPLGGGTASAGAPTRPASSLLSKLNRAQGGSGIYADSASRYGPYRARWAGGARMGLACACSTARSHLATGGRHQQHTQEDAWASRLIPPMPPTPTLNAGVTTWMTTSMVPWTTAQGVAPPACVQPPSPTPHPARCALRRQRCWVVLLAGSALVRLSALAAIHSSLLPWFACHPLLPPAAPPTHPCFRRPPHDLRTPLCVQYGGYVRIRNRLSAGADGTGTKVSRRCREWDAWCPCRCRTPCCASKPAGQLPCSHADCSALWHACGLWQPLTTSLPTCSTSTSLPPCRLPLPLALNRCLARQSSSGSRCRPASTMRRGELSWQPALCLLPCALLRAGHAWTAGCCRCWVHLAGCCCCFC